MTTYSIALSATLICASMMAFRAASSSSLQGALLERRLVHRLIQLLSALLCGAIAEMYAPNLLVAFIPVGVFMTYATICIVFKKAKKFAAPHAPQRTKEVVGELKEAALAGAIAAMVANSIVLLLVTAAINMPKLQLNVSGMDIKLSHSLLLATSSLLVSLLLHTIILYFKNPGERDGTNQSLLRLQQKLRNPPTMR